MKKPLTIGFIAGVCTFVAAFLLFRISSSTLEAFDLITRFSATKWTLICSAVVAVIATLIVVTVQKSEKKTKLGFWAETHASKISSAYLLALGVIASIRPEAIWSLDDMKEIISLEWEIFGLSLTIFLVWNIVMKYLQNKMPSKPTDTFPTRTWKYIQRKREFYVDATLLLRNIDLLTINLPCLTIATVFTHVATEDTLSIAQGLVILALILTTNTLLGLFFAILRPFREEKRAMLEGMKVTSAEIDLQNKIDAEGSKVLAELSVVDALPDINEEQRTDMTSGILKNYEDKFRQDTERYCEVGTTM